MQITKKKGKNGTDFFLDGAYIGCAASHSGATDRFVKEDEGFYRWERVTKEATGHMEMVFTAAYKMEYNMIPARMYNQNYSHEITGMSTDIWDKSGQAAEEEPSFPVGCFDKVTGKVRTFAWWRSSTPGAAYTEGNGLSVGTFLPPDQRDASFSITPGEGDTAHTYYWPLAEGPRVAELKKPGHYRPPAYKDEDVSKMFAPSKMAGPYTLSIEPRNKFAVMLVFAPAKTPKTAWHNMLSSAWRLNRGYRPAKFTNEELWRLGVQYTKSMFCEGENGFWGFTLGKVFIDGKWVHRPYYRYEMGWTGQGIALGTNMLYEAIRSGDKEAEEIGFKALDSWLKAELPSGMLPTHIMGQQFPCNGRNVIDACNLSAGALGYFRAADYAQALGKPKPEYFEAAMKICDFTLKKMNSNGKLAKTWYEEDLSPAAENGSTGAFLVLPLCEAAHRTSKPEYLEGAVRCYEYYYNDFMRNAYSFGGAQDKFSIDKESGIPMLQAALRLYRLTGDKTYIKYAKNGAYYLSTWQWQHTHPMMPDSILGRIGYDTYGGTSVSINGSRADNDPYALPYIHDLYDLAELTGEAEWAERAHAAWLHSCEGLSDGSLVVADLPIPAGGQEEAYGFGRPYEDSGFAWMPGWMNCFRMENMIRTMPGGDRPGRVL